MTTGMGQIATRKKIPGLIADTVSDLLARGWGPAQIDEELRRRVGLRGDSLFGLPYPSLRTVQRMARSAGAASPAWQLGDPATTDARPVLAALAEVLRRSEGKRSQLTRAEAAWVMRISHAAEGIPPWWAYRLARLYIARGEHGTEDIEQILALRPWDGPDAFARYEQLVRTDRGRPHPEGYTLALTLTGRS